VATVCGNLPSDANWCSIYGARLESFSAIEFIIFAESQMHIYQVLEAEPSLARRLQKVNTWGSKTINLLAQVLSFDMAG